MTTLSVVIPAFNEEDAIGRCLDHLLNQTRPVDEIVVVDNASTDGTAEIVVEYIRRYSTDSERRIRLLPEPTPGVVEAVSAGMSAAAGDVVARIDADSQADPAWAERVLGFFDDPANGEYGAMTGLVMLSDGPARERLLKMQTKAAEKFAGGKDIDSLAGANMALRRECWSLVESKLTRAHDVWDDLDLSLALVEQGVRCRLVPGAVVDTSGRQLRFSPIRNRHYLTGGVRTAKARGDRRLLRRMRADLPFRFAMATVLWLIMRPWDDAEGTWRPYRLFRPLERERALITDGRDGHGSVSPKRL
ncbi:glycosyltransferase [Gordonia sp. HY285]|uniref:glycosyltransferase n=1 Tax=Gordonia liuliyuniae TaxID=2911517 RepID=UPI001F2E689C|nr:glycosyltransferase [Gordonia liuliyuniae]MCF8609811.1 glycosyltransferase [Gordonia liuliyuniae]